MDETLKEMAKQTGGVLTEVYKDALSPSVKPIGTMLSYLPRTIKLAFNRWEKWIINGEESLKLTEELIKKKIEQIPEEKICEPEPYVAIPAIQQISYCENSDDLRELYANLLVSSMNVDRKWKVHPAYVEIIKQLNPDEAKIIKSLPPNISIIHPLIDVKRNKQNGETDIILNFTNVGMEDVEHKSNICSYIDNLERLKLIRIPPFVVLSNKGIYEELKKDLIIGNIIDETILGFPGIKYYFKTFNLTNFGVSFVQTCCI